MKLSIAPVDLRTFVAQLAPQRGIRTGSSYGLRDSSDDGTIPPRDAGQTSIRLGGPEHHFATIGINDGDDDGIDEQRRDAKVIQVRKKRPLIPDLEVQVGQVGAGQRRVCVFRERLGVVRRSKRPREMLSPYHCLFQSREPTFNLRHYRSR